MDYGYGCVTLHLLLARWLAAAQPHRCELSAGVTMATACYSPYHCWEPGCRIWLPGSSYVIPNLSVFFHQGDAHRCERSLSTQTFVTSLFFGAFIIKFLELSGIITIPVGILGLVLAM